MSDAVDQPIGADGPEDDAATVSNERVEQLARRLVDAKRKKFADAAVAERSEKRYRELEQEFWQVMSERLGNAKTFTLPLGDGYGDVQFQRSQTVTGRILNGEEAKKALEELGWDQEVIDPVAFRKKVLNAKMRELDKAGKPPPPGLDIHKRRYVTVTEKG